MARFDVYRFSEETPYIVDIQAGIHSELATCIVVPLVPKALANKEFLPKLNPLIVFEGVDHVFITAQLGSVLRSSLNDKVGNLEAEHRQTIVDALDFLFQGF